MFMTGIESFWLGFVITAIPGAVFFEAIRRVLADRDSVTSFILGNYVGMLIIILFAFGGVSLVAKEPLTNVFYTLNGVLLIVVGLLALRYEAPDSLDSVSLPIQTKKNGFFIGLLLAIANPLSIIFWVSLVGRFMENNVAYGWVLFQVASVVMGSITLFVLLILVVKRLGKRIKKASLRRISLFLGFLLIAYGSISISKIFV